MNERTAWKSFPLSEFLASAEKVFFAPKIWANKSEAHKHNLLSVFDEHNCKSIEHISTVVSCRWSLLHWCYTVLILLWHFFYCILLHRWPTVIFLLFKHPFKGQLECNWEEVWRFLKFSQGEESWKLKAESSEQQTQNMKRSKRWWFWIPAVRPTLLPVLAA